MPTEHSVPVERSKIGFARGNLTHDAEPRQHRGDLARGFSGACPVKRPETVPPVLGNPSGMPHPRAGAFLMVFGPWTGGTTS